MSPIPHRWGRTGIALLFVFGAGIGVGASMYKNGLFTFDKTVDITFSLECRELDSILGKRIFDFPWLDFRTDQENDDNISRIQKSLGAEWYRTGVRLAFNHGIADDTSTYAASGLRVVEATQEYISMQRDGHAGGLGFQAEGLIDRRTGYGEIKEYPSSKAECLALSDIMKQHGDDALADSYRGTCDFPTSRATASVVRNHLFRCKPSPRSLF